MTDSPDGGPLSSLEASGCLQLPYVGTDGPNLAMATQMTSVNDPDAEHRRRIVQQRMDVMAERTCGKR